MNKYLLGATAAWAVGLSGAHPASAAVPRPILASEANTADSANTAIYLGLDSNLHEIAHTASGWSADPLTGASAAPAVAAATGLEAHVNTVYGPNEVHYLTSVSGSLHVEQLYGDNLYAQDLTVIGSGVAAAAGTNLAGYIDSVAATDNEFYLGTDQRVHLLAWSPSPGWGEDAALDGTTIAPAILGSPISGHATAKSDEIFYVGTNHHVYEVWRWSQHPDGWHPIDVTAANGSKPTTAAHSPLVGFYDGTSSNDAMFYIGANKHVYELLFTAPAVWKSVDLTAGSSAPAVGSGSPLAADLNTTSQSEEVFFLDANRQVNILWSWSSPQKFDGWHTYNVSQSAAGAPPAGGNSPLAANVSTIDNSDNVYYVASDKHVHGLRFNETSGGWVNVDLNRQTTPVAPQAVP